MGRSQGRNPRSTLLGESGVQIGSRNVRVSLFRNEEQLIDLLKNNRSWQLEEFWQEFRDKLPKNITDNFQKKLKEDRLFKEFIKSEKDKLESESPDTNLTLDKQYYLDGFNNLAAGNSPIGPAAIGLMFRQYDEANLPREELDGYVKNQIELARGENDLENYMNWYLVNLKEYLLNYDDDFYGRELMPSEISIGLEAIRNTSSGSTPGGVNRSLFSRISKRDSDFYPSDNFPSEMGDEDLSYRVAKGAMSEIGYSTAEPVEILKEKADQIATEAIIDHLLAVFEGGYSTGQTFTPTKSRIAQFIVHPNKEVALEQLRILAFDKAEEVILDQAIKNGLTLPDDPSQLYHILGKTASSMRKDPTMQVIRALVDELKALS